MLNNQMGRRVRKRSRDRQKPRWMKFPKLGFWCALASCLGTVLAVAPTLAQISGDGTSGTTVFSLGVNSIINGGMTAGNNLFHSFDEFSVPTGNVAAFNNSIAIENIIGRVTGGNISTLEGIISANGTANLFLINPAGITFGSNAIINIGGSFFASTADSILFDDGVAFAASSVTPPLLTVSAPAGLAFQGSRGQIRVEGSGHNRTTGHPNFGPIASGTPQGIQLYSGGTLALVGNGAILAGGEVFAPGGRVEVASVQSGRVGLSLANGRWQLTFPDTINFADIQLSDRALIDASDFITFSGNGAVQVAGRQIALRDASLILLQNFGTQDASGSLEILAAESVEVVGASSNGSIRSDISTQTLGSGKGADVRIRTNRLSIRQGGRVSAYTYGLGRGGDITANASEWVEIDDFAPQDFQLFAAVAALTFNAGRAGDIAIDTARLRIAGGGSLSSTTASSSDSGNIRVNATESIEVIGGIPEIFTPSNISAATAGAGNAGNVILNTRRLTVRDGGRVDSSTVGTGRGGSVEIVASDSVEVSGGLAGSINPSLIISSSNIIDDELAGVLGVSSDSLTGDSGRVTVRTNQLRVSDEAEIAVKNDGTGNAGTLQVRANRIELSDGGRLTAATVSGEGGNIDLQAEESLFMQRNALISASSVAGNAGNVTVETSQLQASDESEIAVTNDGTGNAGTLQVRADRIELSDGGRLTAATVAGAGGNIDVQAEESLSMQRNALISASSVAGNAGNVTVETSQLQASDEAEIAVKNDGTGNAGTLQVRADRIELSDGGRLTAATASGEGGNIDVQARELLLMRRGALISAEAGGTGDGGNITINAPFIVAVPGENSDIIANAVAGGGGNIDITTQGIFGLEFRDRLTESSDITASSEFGVSGTVTISNPNVNATALNAELQGDVLDPDQQVARGCDAVGNSRFIATGRGGIPDNPVEGRSETNAWSDVRDLSAFRDRAPVISHQSPVTSHQLPITSDANPANRIRQGNAHRNQLPENGDSLVEATGWRVTEDGTVEIYAADRARQSTLAFTDCAAQPTSHSLF